MSWIDFASTLLDDNVWLTTGSNSPAALLVIECLALSVRCWIARPGSVATSKQYLGRTLGARQKSHCKALELSDIKWSLTVVNASMIFNVVTSDLSKFKSTTLQSARPARLYIPSTEQLHPAKSAWCERSSACGGKAERLNSHWEACAKQNSNALMPQRVSPKHGTKTPLCRPMTTVILQFLQREGWHVVFLKPQEIQHANIPKMAKLFMLDVRYRSLGQPLSAPVFSCVTHNWWWILLAEPALDSRRYVATARPV